MSSLSVLPHLPHKILSMSCHPQTQPPPLRLPHCVPKPPTLLEDWSDPRQQSVLSHNAPSQHLIPSPHGEPSPEERSLLPQVGWQPVPWIDQLLEVLFSLRKPKRGLSDFE